MSTKVEEFNSLEERNFRLAELRKRGHNPNKTTETIPTGVGSWKLVWYLSYGEQPLARGKRRS